jgi:biotin synthase-related radical SAM superfamily protein
MNGIKFNLDNFLDSLLILWGVDDNPTERPAKNTLKDSPAQKIKNDLKKVNSDFRSSYHTMRKNSLSICE